MKPAVALLPAVAVLVAQSSTPPVRFEPIQPELFSAGATLVNAAADYDGDGDVDLFVGFNGAPNRLYRNDLFTANYGPNGLLSIREAVGQAVVQSCAGASRLWTPARLSIQKDGGRSSSNRPRMACCE